MNEICSARNVSGMIVKLANDEFEKEVPSSLMTFCNTSELVQWGHSQTVNSRVLSAYTAAIQTLEGTDEQENNGDKFCGNVLRTPFPSFGV